jgi:hypothetical protein
MVGPVADTRDVIGQRRQLAGHEIPKRLPARIDVSSVAVHEIHRHIEHVIDITFEPEARIEDKRQRATAVSVGIGPDVAAMTEQAGGSALDKRRIGEQRHRNGL